jgi:NADPH-dependent 2,4-dienoyl-CoA reductase/sulfur reductase-like enzyme
MRFVIIGGDAAGMSAASRAKRNRPDMNVVVLEQTMDVSYSACGMPYNIADPDRDMDDLVVRKAHVFKEKQGIDLRIGHRAVAIDPHENTVTFRTIHGEEETLTYDNLLLATGASPTIPDLPGFDLPGVLALKSLEQGRQIKQFIKDHKVERAVIIGMGYIALEMCEALRANNITVDMIKPRSMFIPWMNPNLAEMVREEIEVNQVGIHAGHEIQRIEKAGNNLRVSCKDMELTGQMILVAIGVTPNSQLAEQAGLDLGPSKSIAVDKALRASKDHIYSAGDCADAFHVVTGQRTWIPLALRANRAGWAVADNVLGKQVELEGVAGTAVFKVFNLQVARTGLSVSEAEKAGFEPAEVMITSRTRAHAHQGNTSIGVQMVGDRKSGRLLGVQMVGREGAAHRINAPAVALHQKMTVESFSQCDLAYAPPFSPVWDPMLTAATQLMKQM